MKLEQIQTPDPYPEAIIMNHHAGTTLTQSPVAVSPPAAEAVPMKRKRHAKKEPAFDPSSVQWKMATDVGALFLVASDRGLEGVWWEKKNAPFALSIEDSSSRPVALLEQAARELKEFLAGTRRSFDVPLAPAGTDFQRRVWAELVKIPYGETTSYAEIARRLKKDRAVRAVGTANARNPFCVIVPCHRVIASNGTIAGYAGGVPAKEKLIALEKRITGS